MEAQRLEMQTVVLRIRKGSQSMKTTIPEAYVQLLKLNHGDKLDWDHTIVNGEIILKVRKAAKK